MVASCSCVPSGVVMYLATLKVPEGWLECDGSEVSIKENSALYEAIGDTFGKANCSDMFRLPDLRGQFIRSFDKNAAVDEKREFGSEQGDAIRNITGCQSNKGGVQVFCPNNDPESAFYTAKGPSDVVPSYFKQSLYHTELHFDASRVVPTASENRPKNVALLACIKR